MSNHQLVFCLFLATLPVQAWAQSNDTDTPKNLIKVNLLSPVVRTASFFYERVLNEKSSLQLGIYYTGASFSGTLFRGVGITPEYRFYLSESKQSPAGFFVAPFLRYQNLNLSDKEDTNVSATYSSFGGGVCVGNQWLFKDQVSIELFGGPSFNATSFNGKNGATRDDFFLANFGYFSFRFGITLGFAFGN
ncbi:MAG: DUF3575 domain-containing protein [Cytophagales bacterium]|nr:DUF3575 domain-containing protein [Bernardetiaceae bacterium]MDW8203716.1 DUF3575 domain-containing protein [Cytophagales bacterium]